MSYSGIGVARIKVYHPVEDEDGDLVGPGDWDLFGGIFTTTGAKFGKGYKAASGEVLATGTDIAVYDNSDTGKTLTHFYWTPLGLGIDQVPYFFSNAAFSGDSLHMQYDNGAPGTLEIQRTRVRNLLGELGGETIFITSNPIDITSGTPISVVGYVNSDSNSEGKIFVNGSDITASVSSTPGAPVGANDHKRVLISNHRNGVLPANVVDEITVIQGSDLSDALVSTWVPLYEDTRAFGHFPVFGSLSIVSGFVGQSVTLSGQGFGKDVLIQINGVDTDVHVRVTEGQTTFKIPNLPLGTFDLTIKNVAVDVTWTESAAFTVVLPPLTQLINATAIDRRKVTATFDRAMKQVDPTNVDDALNPSNYSFRPVNTPEFTAVFTPTVITVSVVDTDTVEFLMDDDLSYARDYEIEALNIESTGGEPLDPTRRTFTFTSVDPRKPERNFQLLNQLAAHSVREDDTGDLRRFISIFQDVQDILLVEKDRFLTIIDIDTAPEIFVDAILCDLGNPFFFDLDLVGKRKLARILVPIYKQKGTKQGIRNVVRFFLGFDVVDIVSVLQDCLILGESELGLDWTLCPSDSFSRFAFSIIVDRVLTQDEKDKLTIIVEYMKPAHTHFLKIIEPPDPEFVDHWELDVSKLDDTTILHA